MKILKLVGDLALAVGAVACTTVDRPVGRQVRIIEPPADLPGARAPAPQPPVAAVALPVPARPPVQTAVPAAADPPGEPPVAVVEIAPPAAPQVAASAAAMPAPQQAVETAPDPVVAAVGPATVIYFEPDAYKFDPSYRRVLAEHARRLRATPSLRLLIQAYADHRGARDYNLALSRKRAETVARFLREAGADAGQLEIVPYGEGRSGETAGERLAAGDRRVELQYRVR